MKFVKYLLISIYLIFVFYITLFCRTEGAIRVFKPLFWELSQGYWNNIALNIMLFIPIGFLIGNRFGILLSFFLSIAIETFQYAFCLGYCEMDDVLNNTLGSAIGVLIFQLGRLLLLEENDD